MPLLSHVLLLSPTYSVMQSMKQPEQFPKAIRVAVVVTAAANIVFAALCVGFYGAATADLVLDNLSNGFSLCLLKLLLCVDLYFTFPIG